jgi:hypothetical protein
MEVTPVGDAYSHSVLAVGLNGTGYYIHWGFVQLSLANLAVIALMVIVFILALVVPFPGRKDRS